MGREIKIGRFTCTLLPNGVYFDNRENLGLLESDKALLFTPQTRQIAAKARMIGGYLIYYREDENEQEPNWLVYTSLYDTDTRLGVDLWWGKTPQEAWDKYNHAVQTARG